MNESVVEPHYSGPLSCQLVNFSRLRLTLRRGQEISKLSFHTLNQPINPRPYTLGDFQYDGMLIESAYVHPSSFLDIARVEARVREHMTREVKNSITVPGAILAVLVVIAAIEPWATNFVGSHYGVSLDANAREVTELRAEVRASEDVVLLRDQQAKLQAAVQRLTKEVNALRTRHAS